MQDTSKFYVFSKDGCGYCTTLTKFLDEKKIQYVKLTLHEDFSSGEFYDKFGSGALMPQVQYQNQNLGGFKSTVRYLSEHYFK